MSAGCEAQLVVMQIGRENDWWWGGGARVNITRNVGGNVSEGNVRGRMYADCLEERPDGCPHYKSLFCDTVYITPTYMCF